jgi:hypothetical protein
VREWLLAHRGPPSLKAAESALDAYATEIAAREVSRKVFRVTPRSASSHSVRARTDARQLQRSPMVHGSMGGNVQGSSPKTVSLIDPGFE